MLLAGQLDLFAPKPAQQAEEGRDFVRAWKDGNCYLNLLVSQREGVWCYGLQISAVWTYQGFAPLPKWNQSATFEEAVQKGTDEAAATCARTAAFRPLLNQLERGQYKDEWL